MYALHGSVPELAARWPLSSGLPPTARQRLQYASSIEFGVPRRYTRDLWQMNHLAGGPVQEALEQAGHAERVREDKAYESGYECTRCGFLGGDGDALHCGGCQYDLCPSCSAIDAPAS